MSHFSFPFQFLAVFEFWRNVECRHWQLGNTVKHKQKIVKCKTLSNMELCEIWVHHHNMVNTVVKFEQKTTSLDFLIYQTMRFGLVGCENQCHFHFFELLSNNLNWNSVISNIKLWFERDKKTNFQINLTILKKAKVVSFFLFQILVKFVKDLRLTDFCAGVHIWRRRKARRRGSRWTWSTASTTTRMGRRRTRREDI